MVSPESLTALAPPPGLLSSELDDLGVTLGPDGATLRVWSANASGIELVVFDDTDLDWITDTVPLEPVGAGVWSVTTPLLRPGTRYAIRVDGPHGPAIHSTPAPSSSNRMRGGWSAAVSRTGAPSWWTDPSTGAA